MLGLTLLGWDSAWAGSDFRSHWIPPSTLLQLPGQVCVYLCDEGSQPTSSIPEVRGMTDQAGFYTLWAPSVSLGFWLAMLSPILVHLSSPAACLPTSGPAPDAETAVGINCLNSSVSNSLVGIGTRQVGQLKMAQKKMVQAGEKK